MVLTSWIWKSQVPSIIYVGFKILLLFIAGHFLEKCNSFYKSRQRLSSSSRWSFFRIPVIISHKPSITHSIKSWKTCRRGFSQEILHQDMASSWSVYAKIDRYIVGRYISLGKTNQMEIRLDDDSHLVEYTPYSYAQLAEFFSKGSRKIKW